MNTDEMKRLYEQERRGGLEEAEVPTPSQEQMASASSSLSVAEVKRKLRWIADSGAWSPIKPAEAAVLLAALEGAYETDYVRGDGAALCRQCEKPLRDHARADWCVVDCDGTLVKL